MSADTTNLSTYGDLPQSFWFSLYAPMQIGTQIGQFLYGAFAISAVIYLHKCKNESWLHRGLIDLLLFTAGIETLFGDIQVIEYTALHPTDLNYVSAASRAAVAWIKPLLFSITPLLCQGYMTLKVLSIARIKRKADRHKARGLLTLGGLLVVLVVATWGVTYGSIIEMVLSKTSSDQLSAASTSAGKAFRAMGGAAVSLNLLVNLVITIVLTSQLTFKRKGFRVTITEGIMGVLVRNNLLVTLVQATQVGLAFGVQAWTSVIPLFIGKLYALTVLLVVAFPAYSASTPGNQKSCDLCKLHVHAIASGIKRCPACGSTLRRDTEMSNIPLSPKEREMSIFSSMPEESDVGIPSLHIKMNPPVQPRYSSDSEGPKGEKQL